MMDYTSLVWNLEKKMDAVYPEDSLNIDTTRRSLKSDIYFILYLGKKGPVQFVQCIL